MTPSSFPAAAAVPTPATGLLLPVLAIGFIMAMIESTGVNTALNDIARDLNVALPGLVWVVDCYTLTFAALLLAGGTLADRIGAKRAYLAGLSIFVAGSLACATAPNTAVLLGARLLQGAGAALFLPSSLGLIAHFYVDDAARVRAIGLWSALVSIASAAGPLVGGALVHQFGWRSLFWINVPIGVVGLVLACSVIPPVEGQRQPSDLLGHLLCAAGLGSLSLVLIEGPAMGWLSAPMLIGMACAAMALSGFAWRIQLAKHPVIPKALCATPGFVALNLVGFLINLAVYGQLLLLSLYLLQSQRADPLQAGWLLMPMMLAFATGSFASASVSARVGRSRALAGGLALAALTALVLAVAHGLSTGMVALAVLVMNCAIGVAIPAMTASTMALSSRLHANSAAASLNAVRQTGALVGVAVAGWVVHLTPGWPERLAANFWTAAVCFGLACVVEMRRHY